MSILSTKHICSITIDILIDILDAETAHHYIYIKWFISVYKRLNYVELVVTYNTKLYQIFY